MAADTVASAPEQAEPRNIHVIRACARIVLLSMPSQWPAAGETWSDISRNLETARDSLSRSRWLAAQVGAALMRGRGALSGLGLCA